MADYLTSQKEPIVAGESKNPKDLLEAIFALADNIPQLAWMADETGWLFWYNQRWFEYTGTTLDQMQGWGWQKVHHPDHVQRVTEKFRDHITRGVVWEDTFPLRGKDGQYRWFLSRAVPIKDENGKILRWFGTNTDITEQREMMQELRASEGRFRIALGSAPISVFTMDCELRYTWLDKGRYGFTIEQMLGKRDDELLPAEDVTEVVALKRSVIETGQGARKDVKVRANGEWIYFYDNLEPVTDDAGEITGLTGAALDITEQRRLELQHQAAVTHMEVQRRLLEHRESERLDIARDVHDGPIQSLVSVLFNIQAAKEIIQDSEAAVVLDQVAAGLKHAVQELRAVVNDLRPPEILRFGLARAIQIQSEDFRVKYSDIQLDLDLVEDANLLPEETCLALYRIYQEAISNVVRHAEASQILIRYYPSGQSMVLEIKDNGKGFALPGDWVTLTQHSHFGMAMMKERVDAVGGKIQIASKPGRGTTVKIKVPMGECAAKDGTRI